MLTVAPGETVQPKLPSNLLVRPWYGKLVRHILFFGTYRNVPVLLVRTRIPQLSYIAVADLLATLFSILPGAVSLAANEWILGDGLCYLNFFENASKGLVICQLMTALALSKMLIVKNPLRAIQFSGKAAHLVAGGMWAYSVIFPAVAIARDKGDVYFTYLTYNCDYKCSWGVVNCAICSSIIGLSVLVCVVVTLVSSVVLMVEARRVAKRVPGGLNWQGVLTVLLTVAVHTIVTLPLATYYISEYHTDNRSLNLYRPAWFIAILAVTANFYIFTLTLPSFREFLKSRILALLMKCCRPLR